jgi:hypothetical protein
MKNLSQITQADAAERPKDNEQIMVAGTVYQSWLRDTSDIIGKRRKVNQVLS